MMPVDDDNEEDVYVIEESSPKVYMADLDSESFTVYEDMYACPLIRLAVRGIYTKGELGSGAPFPVAVAQKIFDMMRFYNVEPDDVSDDEDNNRCFLLESAGEMLIIIKLNGSVEVYKMDAHTYLVERAKGIGNRAIFLCGFCRCISVNADKFPSVDANCIYYLKSQYYSDGYIYMYNLKYQTEERVSEEISRGSPQSIIQLFSSYYDLQ
jgi:hypothetical protein